MSHPGYYPDPSAPGKFRYWDGRGWSNDSEPEPGPKKKSRWWIWLIVVVVVLGAGAGVVVPNLVHNAHQNTVPTESPTAAPDCLTRSSAPWSLDTSQVSANQVAQYTGVITNICDTSLTDIKVSASAYDIHNVQISQCQQSLNYMEARGSAQISCQFTAVTGQISSEKITAMTYQEATPVPTDDPAVCLTTSNAPWTLDTSQRDSNGQVNYIGTVNNSCAYVLTDVQVMGLGYDNNSVQINQCEGTVDSIDANGSAQVSCMFSEPATMTSSDQGTTSTYPMLDQLVAAKIVTMSAEKQ